MRHAGQVVTRTMLLEGVWDYHFDPQTNVIDVHVSRLRQKVDKPFPTAADPHRAQRRLHAARRGRLNDLATATATATGMTCADAGDGLTLETLAT